MRTLLFRLLLAGLVGAGVWAALAWPHLNKVETGRTPEYPDLQPRHYSAPPLVVTKGVTAALERLGWETVGSGRGPGGSQTHAVARTLQLPHDVFIHVKADKGRTSVSVKSESRHGQWDFGQNARNIRAFLEELDRPLK
jgi:hypothetical protein